jgi:hypothetical protein
MGGSIGDLYSGDETIDFDPFGGEWSPNMWCPEGQEWSAEQNICIYPPIECDPGEVMNPDTGDCYDPNYCPDPGTCPSGEIWSVAGCECVEQEDPNIPDDGDPQCPTVCPVPGECCTNAILGCVPCGGDTGG